MVRRLVIVTVIIIFNFQFSILNSAKAQVGDYRHVWAVGFHGGLALNNIGFTPSVTQKMHKGSSFGVMGRYTSEKFFSTICSIQMEVNLTELGWEEDIKTINGDEVINPGTGIAESYKRDVKYLQIPLLAHLAWGKERHGVNAFINAGPQLGFFLSEKVTKNYDTPYIPDVYPD